MIRRARFADLDATTLYSVLRLRVDVFVVEQQCPYPELDGRDAEPSTWHLWTADDAGPTAYLRLLDDYADDDADDDATEDVDDDANAHANAQADDAAGPRGRARIGRVCTRADARGTGLAGQLVIAALELTGPRVVVLDAQSHLAGWYARYGFRPSAAEFVEDGIAHVPMRRAPVGAP